FVQRARRGSSVSSPRRWEAESRSVRRASSGPAPTGSGGRVIAIRATTVERPCAMGLPVFVGSAFVAQYPTGGGNFWVPLQYLLGLRALGVEAHWLELLWTDGDRRRAREFVGAFRSAVERLGVAEWVTLVCFPEGSREDLPGRERLGRAAGRGRVAQGLARRPPARVAGSGGRRRCLLHHRDAVVDGAVRIPRRRDLRLQQAAGVPGTARPSRTRARRARAGREPPSRRDRRPGPPRAARLAARRSRPGGGHAGGVPPLRPGLARRAERRQAGVREGPTRLGERPDRLLPGERPAVRGRGDRRRAASPAEPGPALLSLARRGGRRGARRRGGLPGRRARRPAPGRGGVLGRSRAAGAARRRGRLTRSGRAR